MGKIIGGIGGVEKINTISAKSHFDVLSKKVYSNSTAVCTKWAAYTELPAGGKLPKSHYNSCGLLPPLRQTASLYVVHFFKLLWNKVMTLYNPP
jgi:hypothetical protein